MERFKGRTVFVTGGTGALGRVVAEAFYSEGASLVITHLHDKENARALQSLSADTARAMFIKADVTDEGEVKSAFNAALMKFGTIDFLVNIAGGYMGKTPIEQLELKDWDYMMNLNLKSAFLCTREALKIMKERGTGRVVNISAMSGLNPSAGRGAYGISKAAVATLTKIAAQEVKGTSITVNALAPSIIVTEANVRSSPGEDYSKWIKPEEIAELIVYLCSEAANSINGDIIELKGGM
jgi:NAD(P)-dependent dehydrogenase (short-subunit alcohol dehydrogenase family)